MFWKIKWNFFYTRIYLRLWINSSQKYCEYCAKNDRNHQRMPIFLIMVIAEKSGGGRDSHLTDNFWKCAVFGQAFFSISRDLGFHSEVSFANLLIYAVGVIQRPMARLVENSRCLSHLYFSLEGLWFTFKELVIFTAFSSLIDWIIFSTVISPPSPSYLI